MPNPACLVNSALPPVDVTAAATVTVALQDPSGAQFWLLTCTSTDELSTTAAINATISINQSNKTATFTAPALGSAVILTSVVGVQNIVGLSGLDANGVVQPTYTTTLKVNVKASNGGRVIAANEKTEQNSIAGWIAIINALIRAGGSVPTTVGGTGFPHVTSGSFDANARAVNLASTGAGGDVTGTAAVGSGGTGVATLTAHALVVGEGTSPVATVGPGGANTVLQGQGASADPAFSMFTMAAPGTSGNVMTSSGGNWVSAAPTGGGGGSAAPVRKNSTNNGQALLTSETNVYANTGAGSAAFTLVMFGSPTDGQRFTFYDDHLAWTAHNLTLTANTGQKIWNPATSTFTANAGSIVLTDQVRFVFEYDATLNQWGPG